MHAKAGSKSKSSIMDELVKGKETATRLQTLLLKPPLRGDPRRVLARDLALQIITSFTHTLSILTSKPSGFTRDRRGCYKRRRSEDSRVTISPVMGDSYAWRKYGQKIIMNSEYPRCYFRCTNKYDQGCKATKQVQITQQNPVLYQTTYFNLHTCTGDLDDLAPPPTAVSASDPVKPNFHSFKPNTQDQDRDHDQTPANFEMESKQNTPAPISQDIDTLPEIERSLHQWLDLTGPEYGPHRANSYQEEGFHSSTSTDDLDIDEFGDIDNFHLDEIFKLPVQ